MARRIAGVATAAALQLIALVLAHELVFLARYGSRYGEALVHAGHGQAWTNAVTSSLTLGAILAAIAIGQLVRLGVLARRAGGRSRGAGILEPCSWIESLLRVGPRTAAISVVALTVQENVERAAIGASAPGPGLLLSPEYPGGLLITIAVGFVVAAVASLFTWRREVLLARLRAARARLPRTPASTVARSRPRSLQPAGSVIGWKSALRAPPLPATV